MKQKQKIALIVSIVVVVAAFTTVSLIYLPTPFKSGISGIILNDTTWEGEVYISGDILVMPWVTLTIAPGTHVSISADGSDTSIGYADNDPDDLNTGDPTVDAKAGGRDYVRNHVDFIVLGTIISKGSEEKPIIFTSSGPNPTYTDWNGISVKNGEFAFTTVEYSIVGIYTSSNYKNLTLDHCNIRHIFSAGVGILNPEDPLTSKASVKHSTISDCGHEAIDTHSCGNIKIAYNIIEKSQVGLNLRDDGEIKGMYANVNHNQIVDCTMPILLARSVNASIKFNVIQAQIQDNTRWHYQDFITHQFDNEVGIFIEPGAPVSVLFKHNIIYDSPRDIEALDFNAVSFVFDYNNLDNIGFPVDSELASQLGDTNYNFTSGFIDKLNSDFHLTPASLLHGIGDPLDAWY